MCESSKATFYLLDISCFAGGLQKSDYYVFNSLNEVKQALCNNLSDLGSLELLFLDESIFLYIVQNSILISKINVRLWLQMIIKDICNVTFGINKQDVSFLAEDEHDKEIFDEFASTLEENDVIVSDDFTKISIETQPLDPSIDGFDSIEIQITYPDIPIVVGNIPVNLWVNVPSEWLNLPSQFIYNMASYTVNDPTDVITLHYGENK